MGLFAKQRETEQEAYLEDYDPGYSGQFFGNNHGGEEYIRTLAQITLDNDGLLEEIENALRGRQLVLKDGRAVYSPKEYPSMNEDGIQAILGEVKARIGKNVILSNLTDGDARKLMKKIHIEITFLIAMNTKRFEIDEGRKSAVLWQVSNLIWFSLSRAVGEGERRHLYTRPQEIHTINEHRGLKNRMGFGLFNN